MNKKSITNGQKEAQTMEGVVLIGVLRSKNDRKILLQKHWYRIPIAFLPKRHFDYLAFYQPALFGKKGKRIEYYGRITQRKKVKRLSLLPSDTAHPRAFDDYMKFKLNKIDKLPCPIKNIVPRRVSFGLVNLSKLFTSRSILELYNVPPTEQIVKRWLGRLGVTARKEYTITQGKSRYRLDFAVFCQKGPLAIECDNDRAHSGKLQKIRDRRKDLFLKRKGWRVLRLKESDILERPNYCLQKLKTAMGELGGQI